MSEEKQFEIRDLRHKEKFFLDDEFLNGYAKLIGPTAVAIYCSLSRHANKQQKCWPGIDKIAEELGTSQSTIVVHIKKLFEHNIVHKIRVGKRANNRYDLIDKKYWTKVNNEVHSSVVNNEVHSSPDMNLIVHSTESHSSNSKDTHSKDTHNKDNVFSLTKEEIQQVIDTYREYLFKSTRDTPLVRETIQKCATALKLTALELIDVVKKKGNDQWFYDNCRTKGIVWFFSHREKMKNWIAQEE